MCIVKKILIYILPTSNLHSHKFTKSSKRPSTQHYNLRKKAESEIKHGPRLDYDTSLWVT